MLNGLVYVVAAVAVAMVILFAAVDLFGRDVCDCTDVTYTPAPAANMAW
jgi:hypothetical protein